MMKKTVLFVALLLTLVVASGVLVQTVNAEGLYVAGKFAGKYFYDNGSFAQFEGMIQQQGAKFWGECVDQDGSRSTISGMVNGRTLDFIKTYNRDNRQVQYTGDLIPETNTVRGSWRIDQNNIGTFTMTIRGNRM